MLKNRIPETGIDCLRWLTGKHIVSICCPTVDVYETHVTSLSISLRLEEGSGFIILEPANVQTKLAWEGSYIHSRLNVWKSDVPLNIPYIPGKKSIVGPCSVINVRGHFPVYRIDLFEYESTVTEGKEERTETITVDKQLTLYPPEGVPISIWTESFSLWFARGIGLAAKPRAGLRCRISFENKQ